MSDILLYIIEIFGFVAFGVSGAMIAIDEEADLFGVLFLGITTAFGGGIIRDVLLGIFPAAFFSNYVCLIISAASALAVFILAAIFKNAYLKNEKTVTAIFNVFDALGLGVFAVRGVQISIEAGQSAPFIAIFMGMTTCIGGGIIRDLLLGTAPLIFRKRIYALAAIAGSAVYYVLYILGANEVLATFSGVFAVFLLRMLATTFRWNLPCAIHFDGEKGKTIKKKEHSAK